jgi:MIP family channel proteins
MTATTLEPRVALPPDDRAQPSTRLGLHGHPLDASIVTAALAEAAGTFILGVTILGAVVAVTLEKPVAGSAFGSLMIPLTAGIGLAVVAACIGPISGAHVNPAVTVSLALDKKFPWNRVPLYAFAQFIGAIGAALVVWWFYGPSARSVARLGATQPAPGVDVWRVVGVEAVATFVLVFVIISVAQGGRGTSFVAPFAIGSALAAAFVISGPIAGGGVNPAGALAPMIVSGKFTDWWAYLIAPIIGGALAAALHRLLFHASTA